MTQPLLQPIEVLPRHRGHVVLLNGRIVESGTPAGLIGAGGAFAALFGDEVVAA